VGNDENMKFETLFYQNDISREMSIFSQASDELMQFEMPEMEDVVFCAVQEEQCLSVQPTAVTILQKSILSELEEYHICCHELTQISKNLRELSGIKELLRANRIHRKELLSEKAKLEEQAAEKARIQLFGVSSPRQTFCWKNAVYATFISSLCTFLPQLNAISIESPLRYRPVFTNQIAQLKQRISDGYRFAVEGGPCLFGADEAEVLVQMKGGSSYSFDFATEKEATGKIQRLSEFAMQNAGMGKSVTYRFYKTALTEAEYNSLVYVLEVASAFGVDAYIPLPDFSYEKYMVSILKTLLPEGMERETAKQQFHEELHKVTELYLKELERLQKKFPEVRVTMIYEDSQELRRIYREKRAAFLNYNSHMMKTLTTMTAKRESILDYITMPALPYYLDGITEIIQVDCIDETDSYRKCQKLHRKAITIYPLLYPEPLSSDGKHTIYYAKKEHKKYRKELNKS